MDWHTRSVDRNLLKVRAAMTIELRIKVGKQSSLEQRVVREVDTANDMTDLVLATS